MNFQAYLEDTYRIVKEEPITLILGGLLVQLLIVFSLGILAGPLAGGYILLVILYLREDRKPVFNDIFSGLKQFAELFPYFLILLLIFFGLMLMIVPGLIFATWWLYALPLMVDRKMPVIDAMRLSRNKVNETGFLMHLIFLLLISVIPMMLIDFVSTLLPFAQLLKIFLTPLQFGCLASLYIDQFNQEETPGPTADDETESAAVLLSAPGAKGESDAGKSEQEHGTEESSTSDVAADEKISRNDSVDKSDDGEGEKTE
jgi:hypothetical protein